MLKARRPARGVATVEFQVVALLALLPLCLGTVQIGLLMSENHHVDHAAFHAARQAAMEQGNLAAARRAFAQAASVLFVDAGDEVEAGNVAQRVGVAYAAAFADLALHSRFRILNPGAEAQADFGIQRGGVRVIPNDGLEYRAGSPGPRSGQSIQAANLLRLEVTWCRPLIVPFARQILLGALRLVDRDPWRQYCYAQGRIALRSEGVTVMQSDFRVSS